MKKTMMFIIILFLLSNTAFANDNVKIPEILTGTSDFSYPDIDANNEVADALLPQNIISYIISNFQKSLNEIPNIFVSVIVVIFISAVTGIFTKKSSIGKFSGYISLFTVILLSLKMLLPLLSTISQYLDKYIAFMTSMISTTSILLTSSGNAGAAITTSASAGFAVGVTQILSANIVLPLVKTVIALSVITSLTSSLDLSGIINFIRSTCMWGLGALFAIFGGVHTVAVNISSKADSLALRGIRFSAARLIPVAGNMISESIKTVVSGTNIIKSTAGGIGIGYIIYSLVPTICAVVCVKFIILAGIFTDKLVGTKMHISFLDGINSALNILLGICIFSAVCGIIIFAVFMNTVTSV